MENINQWAFDAVTGHEGSAAVDDWQEMSLKDLEEQAEAQVEFFAPEEYEGEFDSAKVAAAIYAARETGQSETYHIRAELAE